MTENQIRFDIATIKFDEITELARLLNNFFKQSNFIEKVQQTDFYNNPDEILKIFTEIPEIILESPDSMRAFIKIVEYVFGIDIDDEKGVETLKLVNQTLHFIQEVNVSYFLSNLAMTLKALIKG